MGRVGLDALEGTTLAGKYRLVSLLGSGGMGTVYRAEQLGLRRSVAVKLLRRDKLQRSNTDLFRSEALAASRINHPNAVAIYDVGITSDGTPYLVMEHLRGRTLAAMVDDTELSLERIVTIGAQVLSALHEAHTCSVIHCDLTSDNVIVEHLRDGEDFAKVIDFGLASALGLDGDRRAIAGTPEYMAPEQIRGGMITPAVDIYAMGVLLYELIVGRTPFAGSAVPVILKGHLHAQPPSPDEIVTTCPAKLARLVVSALAKHPHERPPSALHMREQLLASLNGAPRSRPRATRQDPTPPPRMHSRSGSHEHFARGSRTSITTRRATRLSSALGKARPLLIGRDAELEQLLTFARGGGVGNSLSIVGATGSGKARLVTATAAELHNQTPVFFAGPDPARQRLSWYPILNMLESILGIKGDVSVATLTKAVARCGLPDRDVPGLAEIFALSGPAHQLELAARRREAYAAARRVMLSLARRYPRALLVFADVDLYDEPSRKVVQSVLQAVDGSNLRVILTARSADAAPPAANTIELGPLSESAAAELLRARVGGDTVLPPSAEVLAITDGSPAAVEQLAGWIVSGNNAADAPSSLVDLVSVRFHRLPAQARQVLQAVAVHGNVAPLWLVQHTLGTPTDVDDAVLEWTGLASISGEDVTIPSELVADVVDACMPADIRRRFHARALEGLGDHAPHATLGRHAEVAGDLEAAYDHFIAAGQDAVRRFDDAGAATHFATAHRVARMLHAGRDQAAEMCADSGVLLGDVLYNIGELDRAGEVLDAIEATFHPSDSRLAAIEHTRGRICARKRRYASAVDHLHRAIGLALRCGDRDRLCACYRDLSRTVAKKGDAAAAARELEQAIDVITAGQGLPIADAPRKLWFLAMELAERYLDRREVESARAIAEAALQQAERDGSTRGRGRVSALLARIYDTAGRRAAALRHRSNAIDLLGKLGDRRSTAELLLEDVRIARADTDAEASRESAARGLRMAKRLAAEVQDV